MINHIIIHSSESFLAIKGNKFPCKNHIIPRLRENSEPGLPGPRTPMPQSWEHWPQADQDDISQPGHGESNTNPRWNSLSREHVHPSYTRNGKCFILFYNVFTSRTGKSPWYSWENSLLISTGPWLQ